LARSPPEAASGRPGDREMSQFNQDAIVLAKDNRFGDENETAGPDQPFSQIEVEDLLYNDAISAPERLARLRAYRDDLRAQESIDFGDGDPRALVGEIDEAIMRLENTAADGSSETTRDLDPLEHRETLSPDDDDLLDELEEEASEQEQAGLFA